jgi:transglutaminase-like putative cysteine protease
VVLFDSLRGIPDGTEGIRETLRAMRRIVRKFRSDTDLRQLAMAIVGGVRERDIEGELSELLRYVQKKIRYVMDTVEVETLQSPSVTMFLGQGDCDDKSILYATLAESIGHKTRFVAVGGLPGVLDHVLVEVWLPDKGWTAAETIEQWPLGREPKGIVNKMIIHNGNEGGA